MLSISVMLERPKLEISGMLRGSVCPLSSLSSAMKVWITVFVLLFGATELLQWIKQFSLPLPIFILGGIFLAVASNYDKLTHLPFHLDYEEPEVLPEDMPVARSLEVSQAPAPKAVRDAVSDRTSQRPISFTIRKPHQPES